VRGKLVESAQAKGFSPAVYPAERGAGRAVAPTDGLALVQPQSVERGARSRADHAWAMVADGRLANREEEPINIGLSTVTLPVSNARH
jgi:hypothetical protein